MNIDNYLGLVHAACWRDYLESYGPKRAGTKQKAEECISAYLACLKECGYELQEIVEDTFKYSRTLKHRIKKETVGDIIRSMLDNYTEARPLVMKALHIDSLWMDVVTEQNEEETRILAEDFHTIDELYVYLRINPDSWSSSNSYWNEETMRYEVPTVEQLISFYVGK